MRVLIYHNDAEQWRQILLERLPDAEFIVARDSDNPQADYLVAWKPPASLFEEQRLLQGIVNLGAGKSQPNHYANVAQRRRLAPPRGLALGDHGGGPCNHSTAPPRRGRQSPAIPSLPCK